MKETGTRRLEGMSVRLIETLQFMSLRRIRGYDIVRVYVMFFYRQILIEHKQKPIFLQMCYFLCCCVLSLLFKSQLFAPFYMQNEDSVSL